MVLFASLLLVGMLHFNYTKGEMPSPYKISPEKELENTSCWITSAEDDTVMTLLQNPRNTILPSGYRLLKKGVTKK